ncbi:MAG: type II toxin-antitoxin system HicB family antitoxin [Turicibacter sp.]|nr:type II toxin-antitoxin system HicB family antitoxin [Turicibacter sp.]
MTNKYILYPAIFYQEDSGYHVDFPDLEGCFTCGNNIEHAYRMALDVLDFYLEDFDLENLPQPSDIQNLTIPENAFASIIALDVMEHFKSRNKKAVKKTLSIPSWMNELALKANINFSQVLQDALSEKLDLD